MKEDIGTSNLKVYKQGWDGTNIGVYHMTQNSTNHFHMVLHKYQHQYKKNKQRAVLM